MKLTRRDLHKLWPPVLGMLLLVGASIFIALFAHGDALQAEQTRNAASSAQSQIEQRLRQVRTEELEIKERTRQLQQLQQSGITGEERRLDWLELLRDSQHALRLPGMKYEFGAQVPLDKEATAAYAWYASPMHLQLRLLHELDLLNFLERIEREAKALVIVRACKLTPLTGAADAREAFAQLSAECELQWLTVRQVAGRP